MTQCGLITAPQQVAIGPFCRSRYQEHHNNGRAANVLSDVHWTGKTTLEI